jgi:hypothetical protein
VSIYVATYPATEVTEVSPKKSTFFKTGDVVVGVLVGVLVTVCVNVSVGVFVGVFV